MIRMQKLAESWFETRCSQSRDLKIHASHDLLLSDFADLGPTSVRRIAVGAMWPQSPAQARFVTPKT